MEFGFADIGWQWALNCSVYYCNHVHMFVADAIFSSFFPGGRGTQKCLWVSMCVPKNEWKCIFFRVVWNTHLFMELVYLNKQRCEKGICFPLSEHFSQFDTKNRVLLSLETTQKWWRKHMLSQGMSESPSLSQSFFWVHNILNCKSFTRLNSPQNGKHTHLG